MNKRRRSEHWRLYANGTRERRKRFASGLKHILASAVLFFSSLPIAIVAAILFETVADRETNDLPEAAIFAILSCLFTGTLLLLTGIATLHTAYPYRSVGSHLRQFGLPTPDLLAQLGVGRSCVWTLALLPKWLRRPRLTDRRSRH